MHNIYNVSRSYKLIRHWGRAQIADISQTTFSYVLTFSLLKIAVRLFHGSNWRSRLGFGYGCLSPPVDSKRYKGQTGGLKLYVLPFFFFLKIGVEKRHSPRLCSNIGVETIQIFQRPGKGGSKWQSICSNHHIVSTLPGGVFCYKGLRDLISQRHIWYRVKMHGLLLPTTTSHTFDLNSQNSPPHTQGTSIMWKILTTVRIF